jgi:DASS family divalent anion:Na+ symporter
MNSIDSRIAAALQWDREQLRCQLHARAGPSPDRCYYSRLSVATETNVTTARVRPIRFLILVAIYVVVVHVFPRPEAVKPEGWRLVGIFLSTIAGLVIQPIPGGAVVLLAVTLAAVSGALPIGQALAGYADPTVWMVMAAFFISRALLDTGLARRIALLFVRWFGKTPEGICYALAASDMTLATVIPSNAARSGGVVLPILRSIAELYGSRPGPTAAVIGSFLFCGVYQSICVSAAMFFTGQASNPLAAQLAGQSIGYQVTWTSWFAAGIVPGLCSLLLVPRLVMRLNPPEIRRTPEAARFAAGELAKMGPMSGAERVLAAVFVGVCGGWATSAWHGLDVAVVGLIGSGALLVTGVLKWEDVRGEKTAWDIFIWYGGLVRLGKALGETGAPTEFAKAVGGWFSDFGWVALFVAALLIYFYAHYAFASITAHILAMYPAFLAVLTATGAPAGLVVYAFACYTNLAAGLTHYGTTPSPMYFAHEYVSMPMWWRVGFATSILNLLIWSTVGFAWWKAIGYW